MRAIARLSIASDPNAMSSCKHRPKPAIICRILKYSKGSRPEKGKNKAISEWPTKGKQSADYILFAGLTPIAVVEAKRENIDVAGKIPQAQRYSSGFTQLTKMQPAWQKEGRTIAWPDSEDGHFQVPFAYSSNGKPYVKQLAEKSGTWFRDLRELSNLEKPLDSFHSPEGLLDKLTRNKDDAEESLRQEGFAYLKLRDYQEIAIQKVEEALEKDQTECLLAMATGTGKTRTIIGLMYRFLKAERFKRSQKSTMSQNWVIWQLKPKPGFRLQPCRLWFAESFNQTHLPLLMSLTASLLMMPTEATHWIRK